MPCGMEGDAYTIDENRFVPFYGLVDVIAEAKL